MSTDDVTALLVRWRRGSAEAGDELMEKVQGELRRIAAGYLRGERAGHTLQPTAVVNEAYMRLVPQRGVHWENRAHFFGIAAQVMRRILMDHARKHKAEKRGGDADKLPLEDEILVVSTNSSDQLLALDEALRSLAELDPQKAKIVELRYFGGLSIEETAEVMGVSVPTINRQWRTAKAWLYGQLTN